MDEHLAKRLLIIGWDAADWKMIDPLIAAGAMPNLKRLIEAGVRADLASLDPKLSPILWTSIATGKTADKHGILNFIEPEPSGAGVRVASSCSRRTKALWNILTQRGLPTVVVNWYASHPAEPVLGACVSNLFQEFCPPDKNQAWTLAPGSAHPVEWRERISRSRVHPTTITRADVLTLDPGLAALADDDRRLGLIRRLLAQARSTNNIACDMLSNHDAWACAMVFFDAIDVAGHHFMQFHPPRMQHVSRREFEALSGVMNGVYRQHDRMLGELLQHVGAETTIVLLSDHGFLSDHLRPNVQTAIDDEHAAMDATWHRPFGVLVMSGPGVQAGSAIAGASLLDITPTALTLLGLPVGLDMDGRVLKEAFDRSVPISHVESWDIEPGEAGQHPLNLRQDPFEARDVMKQLADLGYIEDVNEDAGRALDAVDVETRSNLGIVFMSTGRPHQAVTIFARLHAERPHDPRFAMNLAHCLHALGRHEEAESTLAEFLTSHPDAQDTHMLRAGLLIARHQFAEAVSVLERAAQAHPNDASALAALAQACIAAGRLADGQHAAARAVTLDPDHVESHHALARIALLERRFEQSAGHALDALERRQTHAEAHHTLGVALAWLGDLDHATQSFRMALSLQPGMVESHRFLAAINSRLGEHDHARMHEDAARRLSLALAPAELQVHDQSSTSDSPLLADAWARFAADRIA